MVRGLIQINLYTFNFKGTVMHAKVINNIVKSVLFVVLILVIGSKLMDIFNYKLIVGGGWQRFYEMDDDIVDVYFVGSSHAHCSIHHGYLWDNYGMAAYTLSAGSQKIDSSYYFVKEILRTKHPKVIAVEVWGTIGEELDNSDSDVYWNTLGMKWSKNLWDFTSYVAENRDLDYTWRNELFIKIPIIHSRYRELDMTDFYDETPFFRGTRAEEVHFSVIPAEQPSCENNYDLMELSPDRLAMLEKIVEMVKKSDVQLLLFAAPYCLADEDQMQFNAIAEFARDSGIPFINFNHLYGEIGLDYSKDIRDSEHVNNYGAEKVTKYIADFMVSEYDMPDRRGQEDYELWEQNAAYLKNKAIAHELESVVNINDYLKEIQKLQEGRTVVLALTGNHTALGEVYLENLIEMGITQEEYYKGGVWIFKDGEIVMQMSGKEYNYCYPLQNGEIHLESHLQQKDGDFVEKVTILVNGVDYHIAENGVNIIVYDEVLNQIVDAVGDDIYLGMEISR